MQLSELKKEHKFSRELVTLIETLKNIAAAQYHLMEREKERFDAFMTAFAGFFRVVNLVDVDHPLVRVSCDVLGIVVVTSDSGFMGGLNQGVIQAALAAQGDLPNARVSLVVVGEKGESTFTDMARTFKFFPGVNQATLYEQAVAVKDHIVQEVQAGRMGKVIVVYPRPLSFSAQEISAVSLLPCAALFDLQTDSEVSQRLGDRGIISEARKVIVESSFTEMVEYLAGTWVAAKLYEVFEDSKLAEFSARAMHLEGSFQKLDKQLKKVKHQVSKAIHEKIDKGMRESFGAKKGFESRKRRQRTAA